MEQQAQSVLALYAVQAVGTALLGFLFAHYGRIQDRGYLRRWAAAWWALAVYTACAAIAFLFVIEGLRTSWWRHAASVVSQSGLYLGAALLVVGGLEAARREPLARRSTVAWIVGALVLGAGGALLTALPGVPREVLLFVRIGLRALVEGTVLLWLGATVWRLGGGRGTGIRFAAGALFAYGAVLLALFAVHLLELGAMAAPSPLAQYGGLVEFLMLMLVAVGLALWLQEEEHDRLEQARSEIAHLSSHDGLTGLPNRRAVGDIVRAFLDSAHGSTGVAVAYIGLDRFRRIGLSHGRRLSDAVLRRVADRLTLAVGAGGAAGRVGDDEFVAVLRNVGSRADAAHRFAELHRVLTEPVEAAEQMFVCPISVGTAYARDASRDAEAMLHESEAAMRAAKAEGGNRIVEFREAMLAGTRDDLALELELRDAVERGTLVAHLQPVVDARDGTLVGAEALARWPHATRGLVAPSDFLPLALRAGSIERIDELVLRRALAHAASWPSALPVAVNLSASSLLRADLLALIESACGSQGVPPSRLTLEVTEHDVVADFERGRRRIAALREMGCGVAIDDFGTGYSSLRYLAALPITAIKIDRSFVEALADQPRARALVTGLVGMAESLGLEVTAEGVETEVQSAALVAMGCARQQGYLFHRPLEPAAFAALLAQR